MSAKVILRRLAYQLHNLYSSLTWFSRSAEVRVQAVRDRMFIQLGKLRLLALITILRMHSNHSRGELESCVSMRNVHLTGGGEQTCVTHPYALHYRYVLIFIRFKRHAARAAVGSHSWSISPPGL